MIEGCLLGLMVWLGAVFTWTHLPKWFQRLSVRWFVITDLLFTLLTWLTVSSISQSLVAVIATVFAGLMMNFTMLFFRASKPTYEYFTGTQHEQRTT